MALKARCRVIAASNKDLADEVKRGRFREDLFFRLTPLVIHVPPLRERKDDIPLLCRFFLDRFNRRMGKRVSGISRPAQTVLMSYEWPGNVRELENVIEQAVILTNEPFIRIEDLPQTIREAHTRPVATPVSLDENIKRHLKEVLRQCNGNKTHAARILGISRRSFLRKMEKYSIQ
jgi:DNA-binding NtrC family response regulator